MYDAKDRGATLRRLHPRVGPELAGAAASCVADLRRALELARPDEIQLYYQPQVDMLTGARWSGSRRCCAGTTRAAAW